MREKREETTAKFGASLVRRRRLGWRLLMRERRSVAMVEFAIVGPVFVFCIITLFDFGYLFTTQLVLDAWAQSVARQIQIGLAQQEGTSASFATAVACPGGGVLPNNPSGHYPLAPSWLNCNQLLTYTTYVAQDYYHQAPFAPVSNGVVTSPGASFCNGQAGQLMELNMVYMAPVFLASWLPRSMTMSYLGATAFPLYSTSAFGTEKFPLQPLNPCQ